MENYLTGSVGFWWIMNLEVGDFRVLTLINVNS